MYAGRTAAAAAAAAAAEGLLGQQQRCIDGHELLCLSFQSPLYLFSALVIKRCCSKDADTVVDGSSLEVQDFLWG